LQEAIDSIRSFIPSGAVQQAQTQLLAYNANFQQDDTSDSSKCFRCGKTGHWKADCPKGKDQKAKPDANANAAAVPEPPPKNKVKGKGKQGKSQGKGKANAYSAQIVPVDMTVPGSEDYWDQVFSMHPVAITAHPTSVSKNPRLVTLDSMADHSFSDNLDLIQSFRRQQFNVDGATGSAVGNGIGHLPGFGDIAYLPEGRASGLALCEAERLYTVTYVQGVSWTVHVAADFDLVFYRDAKTAMYSCIFTDDVLARLSAVESASGERPMTDLAISAKPVTVRELEAQYTRREVGRAKEAATLARRLYDPSTTAIV
jgi:hypothetical protein